MPDLILHHYDISPFAEKIRAILGYKGLAWRSVDIPVVMPKPDLTALTGGYRKTPVMQIGCDVYCDTARIARELDRIAPATPVFRPDADGLGIPAGRWFDRNLFFAAIGLLFEPSATAAAEAQLGGPDGVAAFARDRIPMMSQARVKPLSVTEARSVLADALPRLEAQLQAGGPFLSGASPAWADFCAYHPLWALGRNAALAPLLDPYVAIRDWLGRLGAFGHGSPRPLGAAAALEVARASSPRPVPVRQAGAAAPLPVGATVEVAADDYGHEPSAGRLVDGDADEIAIERMDDRAGRVVVHFPRIGYRVKAVR